jgi:hypothetical protein
MYISRLWNRRLMGLRSLAHRRILVRFRPQLEPLEDRTLLAATLVAAYSFSEGSGTTVADSSGNGNTGTFTNATWVTNVNNGKYVSNALQFTGAANSMVNIAESSSLNLTTGMTLEAWADPTSLNSPDLGWDAVISKDNQSDAANDVSYALYAANGTGTPPAAYILSNGSDTSPGSNIGVQGQSSLSLNTWTFLAATYDGSSLNMYVNGNLVGSQALSGYITTTGDPLHIGGDWSGEMFTGLIEGVRIYNGALTQSQIQTDMNTPVQPPDTIPPTVSVTAPANNSTVSGAVTLSANATDDTAVSKVQFQLDGVNIGAPVTAAPYQISWDSTTATNGTHTLDAIAWDTWGNSATSSPVTVTVNNAVTNPPTVSIITPAANSTLGGTVTLSADASQTDSTLTGVQFQIDGVSLGSQITSAPYSTTWDTTTVANGTHTITAIATDVGGLSTSTSITVTVSQSSVPTVTLTSPANNAMLAGAITLSANASSSIGIANVQFSVDGVNVGAPITSGPYQYNWDSTKLADGEHTITATATDTKGDTSSSSVTIQTVNGGVFGPATSMPIVAINMILMHTGQVLLYEGQGTTAQVFDPVSGTFTPVPLTRTNYDLWCSADAQLPDGRILVAGGHDPSGLGSPIVNIFDPSTDTWSAGPNMAYPRWYPTLTTLPDGRMLITAGDDTSDTDHVPYPEVYDPTTNTWTTLSNAYLSYTSYPHMFVLPNGLVAATGSSVAAQPTYELDVATQTWIPVDLNVVDGASSVMYRPGLVMKEGTASDDGIPGNAAATTYAINLNSPNPTWQQTASMSYPRATNTNLVIQPDGNVMVFGGSTSTAGNNDATAVLPTELWNATTQTWKVMASLAVPRMYHSTALLLPDGQILTSGQGGETGVTDELNYQIYSPPYLFEGARPTITSVSSSMLQYGGNFTINTPDAADISSVVLIRPGATTHGFDQNQRYVPLTFSQSGGALTVQAPANGDLAPPGYYMMFLVNSKGVPSVASWVQLPAGWKDTQPPSVPTNLTASGGSGQVNLTWTASTDNVAVTQYNIYRSTTSGFSPSASTLIGTSTTTSYTDNVLPGTYYYLVAAQDAAGNISQPSNQATATLTTAAIHMVQNSGQGFMSSASKISLAFSSNVHAGDTLIVTGAASAPSSSLTISDSAGDTFVPVIGPISQTGQNVTAYTWIAINAKGGPDTVTLTPSSADALEIHISEWSGISQVSPVDQTSSAMGNGSQISSGSKTTTQSGELVYGYAFAGNNASSGSGFTGLSLTNGDLDEYEIQTSAGSVAATFTQQSNYWLAMMATFKPASQDTQPPTAPANLTATTGNVGSVDLSWTAATDDTAVTQYNIYRSTTSGFTPSASTLIGTSTTTSYTDNVAAGTYYYLVIAQDTAGLEGPPSNQAAGISTADTIPPTVTITNPTSGAAVAGAVTVSANASDNVAVASVQFLLDGANYGSPLTSAPFSFSWNSTTVVNGTHTWAAIATDPSGNSTTSATVTFTVNNVAPSGLVAAYGFDENTGTTVDDSSGDNNNGTLTNATWTTGKYGSALNFTGATNSYVTINDAASLDETTGLTVEAWVNPSTLNSADYGWDAAVAKENRSSSANDVSYALYAANGTGTAPALHLNIKGKGDEGVQGMSVLPLNTWTFLAGTYDGATMKLYVNGTLVASRTMAGSIVTSTNPLRIGGDWSGEMFTGVIDNVRIYNQALSASEISTDMGVAVGAQPMSIQALSAGQAASAGGGPNVSTSLASAQMQPGSASSGSDLALLGLAGSSLHRGGQLEDTTFPLADMLTGGQVGLWLIANSLGTMSPVNASTMPSLLFGYPLGATGLSPKSGLDKSARLSLATEYLMDAETSELKELTKDSGKGGLEDFDSGEDYTA